MDGGLFPVVTPSKGNARGSGYARNANDWYVEPPWFVDMLLDAEVFSGGVWDPCCGLGTIPLVCQARGFDASGSDLLDRGFGESIDYFRTRRGTDNVITNPPFNRSEEVIAQALSRGARKVAIVAQIGFLAGVERRAMFLGTRVEAHLDTSPSRVDMPPGQEMCSRVSIQKPLAMLGLPRCARATSIFRISAARPARAARR